MSHLKRTPIYPSYEKYGAKTIDFGGWELPVQFAGIHKEHEAVRATAGLFDVSHMGELLVTGSGALEFLQQILTNDLSRAADGQAIYTLMCYPDGGVIDDLLVYRLGEERYMLVVNAANIDKDLEWLQKHAESDQVVIEDVSDATGLLALQGPAASAILSRLIDAEIGTLGAFRFLQDVQIGAYSVAVLSRTGYTGEDGFELYVSPDTAAPLWELLLEHGREDGLVPAGLGARDTLRFEAKLPLYGQELSPAISPIEAGLGFFVKPDKGEFIGREALARQKREGAARKLVGIEMIDRGIPRSGYPVYSVDEALIGEVTTGTQSPTYKTNIGLALLKSEHTALDAEVLVEIRGKRLRARVVKTPFYSRS